MGSMTKLDPSMTNALTQAPGTNPGVPSCLSTSLCITSYPKLTLQGCSGSFGSHHLFLIHTVCFRLRIVWGRMSVDITTMWLGKTGVWGFLFEGFQGGIKSRQPYSSICVQANVRVSESVECGTPRKIARRIGCLWKQPIFQLSLVLT